MEDYYRRAGNWSTSNLTYWCAIIGAYLARAALLRLWPRGSQRQINLAMSRCRMGITRINGTLRFQMNDGTELPVLPNSVANSSLAYAHWGWFHYLSNR